MTNCWSILLAVALVSAASASDTIAQERGTPISVIPSAGWYTPTGDLTLVSQQWLRMAPGPVLGLQAEARLPTGGIAVRGGFGWVASELTRRRVLDDGTCGNNCPVVRDEFERVAGGQIYLAVADAVIHGPRFGPIQPYLLAGGGIKRYDFAQRDLQGEFARALQEGGMDLTTHVGLGLTLTVGPNTLLFEAGDYISRPEAGPRQNDVAVKAGVRVRVR